MSAVELAPTHKVGLTLTNPCMPAAGCFGFGGEYGSLVNVEALGAVVYGPVTGRPRPGSPPPRLVPLPYGVLVHTGLANPGARALVRRARQMWSNLPVPVIAHVAATTPDEVASCCQQLGALETVAGLELGLTDETTPQEAGALVAAARESAAQPLIVRLGLASAEALCQVAVEAGADALTVAAPPRGTLRLPSGEYLTGRLYGPWVLPLALHALRQVRRAVDVPLIGCGGIHTEEDAQAFLEAGAVAVQVDSVIWRDPGRLARIARALAAPATP
jgi:dihydroorotate dehydrogenase (NAD+) catalytic subunit